MTGFPIKDHPTVFEIPVAMVRPHLTRQQLQDAMSIGGVKSSQAVAILEDRPYRAMPLAEAAARLKELVDQFNGQHTPALAPAVPLLDRLNAAILTLEDIREGRALPHRAALNRLIVTIEAARETLK